MKLSIKVEWQVHNFWWESLSGESHIFPMKVGTSSLTRRWLSWLFWKQQLWPWLKWQFHTCSMWKGLWSLYSSSHKAHQCPQIPKGKSAWYNKVSILCSLRKTVWNHHSWGGARCLLECTAVSQDDGVFPGWKNVLRHYYTCNKYYVCKYAIDRLCAFKIAFSNLLIIIGNIYREAIWY